MKVYTSIINEKILDFEIISYFNEQRYNILIKMISSIKIYAHLHICMIMT